MGRRITIDSATLMNKGLELIEAYHLFPVRSDQLGVLVHPQSIVHCLVEYADGAVVSRTLHKRKTGTLTLFAFDRDQGLSEHTAPFDATVLVVDGRAELTLGGRKIDAAAGQLVVMPADVPHALHAPERFKMLLIMIRE